MKNETLMTTGKVVKFSSNRKYDELLDILVNDTCIRIITFFLINNNNYYTRSQVAAASNIKKASLEHYLPTLSSDKYAILLVRKTVGVGRRNHMKEYRLNENSRVVYLLKQLLGEVKT